MTVDPEYATHDVNGVPLSDSISQKLQEIRKRAVEHTKSNWKTAAARDKWDDILKRSSRAMQEMEWRSVGDDVLGRKAAIIHIPNQQQEEWAERISEHQLYYRNIRYSAPVDGYSHEFVPARGNDPNKISYSVIATEPEIAEEIKEVELNAEPKERHKVIGEYLGYPTCCSEHFHEQWITQNRIDPIYEIACNTGAAQPVDGDNSTILIEDVEPWANIIWRYWGWSFLFHLPCSFDCEESQKIGERYGELLAEHGYREEANAMYEWLSTPHEWSNLKSLARVANGNFLGASRSSCYWNTKRIIWQEEHEKESVVDAKEGADT